MNAQMSKHRVEPPAPMFFDGTETTTGQTTPNFRDEGANLFLSDFRLDSPEQVFAIVMSETEIGLGRQFGPLDIRDCGRVQIASFVNALEL
ncbi:MAG: hypothetical protein WBO09_18895 [Methylocystis silviterrae]|uniref:hypothetical protein n=1 Tax=Methylocystis silviterrae TaxID=2743612 RepID=UPI003C746944